MIQIMTSCMSNSYKNTRKVIQIMREKLNNSDTNYETKNKIVVTQQKVCE